MLLMFRRYDLDACDSSNKCVLVMLLLAFCLNLVIRKFPLMTTARELHSHYLSQFSHMCALFCLHLEGGTSQAAIQELFSFLGIGTKQPVVLTTHRLAYLCCQCDASLDMKLALGLEVARNER